MADMDQGAPASIVKTIVLRIPRGRAASYGTVGRVAVALGCPIGGARTVAWILASLKGHEATPWHRVVGAGGVILLPDRRGALQRSRLRSEGVRFRTGTIEPSCLIDEFGLLEEIRPAGERKPRRSLKPSAAR
ncbi:MAG: MGMT family protein [Vicinamibacteria bacterium]